MDEPTTPPTSQYADWARQAEEIGLSIQLWAALAEVSQETLRDMLLGKRRPHRGTVKLVKAVLDQKRKDHK